MVDVAELKRLRVMLIVAGIDHEYIDEPEMGGATIKVPTKRAWVHGNGVSVIQHFGSFGGPEGKLEVWAKPGTKEPEGWLTAEEVFTKIQDWRGMRYDPC